MAKFIKLTQGKYAIVDNEDFEKVNQLKWQYSSLGYAVHGTSKGRIYLHRFINNTPKGFQTDHINRNGLDNRKINLRTATKSLNMLNRPAPKSNTSGYKGVSLSFSRRIKKWRAYLKGKTLGYFLTREEASEAYLLAGGII